jgi:hypothetical protein
MPALDNPRWERFAQAIVEGLANSDRKPYSQGRAYIAAGYTAKDQGKRGGSAECAASRLLNRVKPILHRVKELQAQANQRLQMKLDLSRERVGRRLDLASRIAEEERNAAAMATSELGIAKVFGHLTDPAPDPQALENAKTMQDIGAALLRQIGLREPTPSDVDDAIAAHDRLVSELQLIRDRSQGLTIEHE